MNDEKKQAIRPEEDCVTIKDREYFLIHQWLIRYYGKAARCENIDCKSTSPKRFEWALLDGFKYERKRENFIQLCPSCHRKYDYKQTQGEKLSKALSGRPALNSIQVILNDSTVFNSMMEAERKTGLSAAAIYNNAKGKTKITRLGTWKFMQKS